MIAQAALLIEAIGSLVIVFYAAAAAWALLRGAGLGRAQGLIAQGALAGLNFKVAATLLKTVELQTWQQIGIFAVTFALRTMLKRLFAWEAQRAAQSVAR